MIVKNEKHVICRCLESVKPIIDHWVIVDTGSTDGTQEVIKEYLKDIPGTLYERPWKNFEHNRNEALELSKNVADYTLIIDADDYLVYDSNFILPQLTHGVYKFWVHHGGNRYQYPHLIDRALSWKWVGVLHELLTCSNVRSEQILDGVVRIYGGDGHRSSDPKKYEKDVLVLEEALKKDPENTRYMFYLAQSYRDAKMKEQALVWYKKRIVSGGCGEEIYKSFINVGLLQKALCKEKKEIMATFELANKLFPYRSEALFYFADMLIQEKKYSECYQIIKKFLSKKKPLSEILFFSEPLDMYGIPFLLSIAAYYVGNYQESLTLCDQLLSAEKLPKDLRKQTIKNRAFAQGKT